MQILMHSYNSYLHTPWLVCGIFESEINEHNIQWQHGHMLKIIFTYFELGIVDI